MKVEPRSCLRLFFSADIAGSTAYKNQSQKRDDDGRPHWLSLYESFFAEFSLRVANEWAELKGIGPPASVRLSRHATPTRTIVAPELAWLLASLAVEAREAIIGIYYDGDVELKGVFGGRPVPLFSIDAGDRLEEARNTLGGRAAVQNRSIIAFVEIFVQTIGNATLTTLPYLVAEGVEWGEQPESHAQEFDKLRRLWEREKSDKEQWDERGAEGAEVDLAAPALRAEG